MAKKIIEWNGITYSSIREAAASLGVNRFTLGEHIRNGKTSDKEVNHHKNRGKRTVIWNDVSYGSIVEAAKAIGIEYNAMYWRVSNGYTSDSQMRSIQISHQKHPRITSFYYKGIKYDSIRQAARELETSYSSMRRRLKRAGAI
jgi:hypothetical protein